MNLARNAVLIAVLLAIGTAAVLLFVTPPAACPGWQLRDKVHTSIWVMFALVTVPVLALSCGMVLRWDWCIEKSLERTTRTNEPFIVPVPYILTCVCLSAALMAQLPLFQIIHCAAG